MVVRQVPWDTQVVSHSLSSHQALRLVWAGAGRLGTLGTAATEALRLHRELVAAAVVVREACFLRRGVYPKSSATVQVVAVSGYWVKDRMALVAIQAAAEAVELTVD